jgi:hypothetical protein
VGRSRPRVDRVELECHTLPRRDRPGEGSFATMELWTRVHSQPYPVPPRPVTRSATRSSFCASTCPSERRCGAGRNGQCLRREKLADVQPSVCWPPRTAQCCCHVFAVHPPDGEQALTGVDPHRTATEHHCPNGRV